LDSNDDSKLANIVRILTLLVVLASLMATDTNARYQMHKLELYARYWIHRGFRQLQHIHDPRWRSKLLDRHENEVGGPPSRRPSWWVHMEDNDAAISIPPSE
jgi:hypothetical protein